MNADEFAGKLWLCAERGNAAGLRRLWVLRQQELPTGADEVVDRALELLLQRLFYQVCINQCPLLMRGYCECVKTLSDGGADARRVRLQHGSAKWRWRGGEAYRLLRLSAHAACATAHDAELVAYLMHVQLYHLTPHGSPTNANAEEPLLSPRRRRETMARAAACFFSTDGDA